MEMHVMQILQKEVIQKLEHQHTVNLSSQLLHGLQELVQKSGETKILRELFKSCFTKSMKELRDLILKKNQLKQPFDSHEYYDALVGLLSASVRGDDDNVETFRAKGLHHLVTDIFKESNPAQSRYLDLLTMITSVCLGRAKENLANFFVDKYVHRNLIKELKKTYFVYKKTNELSTQSA